MSGHERHSILIPVSLVLPQRSSAPFFLAVRSGQYAEDTSTPSIRLLGDEGTVTPHSPPVPIVLTPRVPGRL